MEEIKRIAAKNIKFEYPDNVVPDADKEHSMINNINNWLGRFAEQINTQKGIIVVYFPNEKERRVHFDGMAENLQAILYQQLLKFQLPDNRHSDSPGK